MIDHQSNPGPWEGSTRKQRLPSQWQTIRRQILERDSYRCTVIKPDGSRCWDPAGEVDHIIPNDDNSPANLAAICSWHHRRKSSIEGNAARLRPTNRRPPEPHPGLS
jgi:5-methylcytosine-specific restriction endonuclease McrA